MRLFQLIKQRWLSQNTLPQIADEIADRCVEAVWQRVEYQIGTLAPAEARGYIRARGVAVVQPELVVLSARHEVREHLRPQLHALALEAIIQRVQSRISARTARRPMRRAA
ncbi:MAG: hypothetical protein H6821_13110 [Planctomycetaceae bacterium]|nr:hypothetical protein [Planctomycetales bacterium]MCA9213473.1 hypothetical protein [Planctomycetales bacterium]MCB9875110.1 hypothetical protein [Planctomycetaceae bacterium]MCB9941021.1 hypothetical protein [Planctomycetaceae bacterium]HRX79141.1 hypothetical protein [Pirellulaceae bacterium]